MAKRPPINANYYDEAAPEKTDKKVKRPQINTDYFNEAAPEGEPIAVKEIAEDGTRKPIETPPAPETPQLPTSEPGIFGTEQTNTPIASTEAVPASTAQPLGDVQNLDSELLNIVQPISERAKAQNQLLFPDPKKELAEKVTNFNQIPERFGEATKLPVDVLQKIKPPMFKDVPEPSISEGKSILKGRISARDAARSSALLARMKSDGLTVSEAIESYKSPGLKRTEQLLAPTRALKKNIVDGIGRGNGVKEIAANTISNIIGAAANIGGTLFSPISTGLSIFTDGLKEIPSFRVGNLKFGGKEVADAIDLPFKLLGEAPAEGAKIIDKALPGVLPNNAEIAKSLGIKKEIIDDITQQTQNFNALASTLIGLKLFHGAADKFSKKEMTLEEIRKKGEVPLRKVASKGFILNRLIPKLSRFYKPIFAKDTTPKGKFTEADLTPQWQGIRNMLLDKTLEPGERKAFEDFARKRGIDPNDLINLEFNSTKKNLQVKPIAEIPELKGGKDASPIRSDQKVSPETTSRVELKKDKNRGSEDLQLDKGREGKSSPSELRGNEGEGKSEVKNVEIPQPTKPKDDLAIEVNPSAAQKEAGNYKKQHLKRDGFDITVENPKGTVRSGIDSDGETWEIKMNNTYGYLKGTVGKDKDHLDVFLADNYKEGAKKPVFIVNQLTPNEKFDEHKIMMGFDSMEDARKAYLSNYNKGGAHFSDIVEMPIDEFKLWSKDKLKTSKPAVADPLLVEIDRVKNVKKSGITIIEKVRVEETGDIVEIKTDASEAIRDVDRKLNAYQELLDCL